MPLFYFEIPCLSQPSLINIEMEGRLSLWAMSGWLPHLWLKAELDEASSKPQGVIRRKPVIKPRELFLLMVPSLNWD